jgi:hypothetical protein
MIYTSRDNYEFFKEEFMGIDWYPNSQDEQLHLVKTWNAVFAQSGQTWGIPQTHITQLANDANNKRGNFER